MRLPQRGITVCRLRRKALRCRVILDAFETIQHIYSQIRWGVSVYGGVTQDDGNQHCEVGGSSHAEAHLEETQEKNKVRRLEIQHEAALKQQLIIQILIH